MMNDRHAGNRAEWVTLRQAFDERPFSHFDDACHLACGLSDAANAVFFAAESFPPTVVVWKAHPPFALQSARRVQHGHNSDSMPANALAGI